MTPKKMSLEEARKMFLKNEPKNKSNSKNNYNYNHSDPSARKKIESLEKKLMFSDLDDEQEKQILKQIGQLEKKL